MICGGDLLIELKIRLSYIGLQLQKLGVSCDQHLFALEQWSCRLLTKALG
jgi:hypothetical protein